MFCVALRGHSDSFCVQGKLTGFYNRDGGCLLRGKKWTLNKILRFIPKALNNMKINPIL